MTTTTATSASTARRDASALFRTSLRVDSWGCVAFGILLLAGGTWLSGPLGLPTSWSVPLGIALLGAAAAFALVSGYPKIPSALAATVVVANWLFCIGLLLFAFTGLVPLTGGGVTFVVAGAIGVAIIAEAEFVGFLRFVNVTRSLKDRVRR